MGVRPYIKVVTGLEYSKELHREVVEFTPEPMVTSLIDGKFNMLTGKYKDYEDICLYDVFHYGPPYSSSLDEPKGVIGYIVDEIYDQPITRALFAVWENEILGSDLCQQEYLWPQESRPGRNGRLKNATKNTEFAKKLTELTYSENRMYQYFCGTHDGASSDTWFKCAIYVLGQAGFTQVKREDLHTYLILGWN